MGGWTRLVGRAAACAALLTIVVAGCGDDNASAIDAAALDSSTVPDAGASDSADLADGSEADASEADAAGPDACVPTVVPSLRAPTDIYVLPDQSGTMGADCSVGATTSSPWCHAVNGLARYLQSSAQTGDAAALQFFDVNPVTSSTCSGAGHDIAAVPAGNGYVSLPSTLFTAALDVHRPSTDSALEKALRGITAFTARAVNTRAGRRRFGVVITDGSPNSCNPNMSQLAAILQTHFSATGIPTIVIGVGTAETDANFELLASAGNGPLHPDTVDTVANTCGTTTAPCRHWRASSPQGVTKALETATVNRCIRTLPAGATAGMIALTYTPGTLPPQLLQRVANSAACVANGWYMDGSQFAVLCPQLCTTVNADPAPRLDHRLGCPAP